MFSVVRCTSERPASSKRVRSESDIYLNTHLFFPYSRGIPLETIQMIFVLLKDCDKKSLTLTCRSWYQYKLNTVKRPIISDLNNCIKNLNINILRHSNLCCLSFDILVRPLENARNLKKIEAAKIEIQDEILNQIKHASSVVVENTCFHGFERVQNFFFSYRQRQSRSAEFNYYVSVIRDNGFLKTSLSMVKGISQAKNQVAALREILKYYSRSKRSDKVPVCLEILKRIAAYEKIYSHAVVCFHSGPDKGFVDKTHYPKEQYENFMGDLFYLFIASNQRSKILYAKCAFLVGSIQLSENDDKKRLIRKLMAHNLVEEALELKDLDGSRHELYEYIALLLVELRPQGWYETAFALINQNVSVEYKVTVNANFAFKLLECNLMNFAIADQLFSQMWNEKRFCPFYTRDKKLREEVIIHILKKLVKGQNQDKFYAALDLIVKYSSQAQKPLTHLFVCVLYSDNSDKLTLLIDIVKKMPDLDLRLKALEKVVRSSLNVLESETIEAVWSRKNSFTVDSKEYKCYLEQFVVILLESNRIPHETVIELVFSLPNLSLINELSKHIKKSIKVSCSSEKIVKLSSLKYKLSLVNAREGSKSTSTPMD